MVRAYLFLTSLFLSVSAFGAGKPILLVQSVSHPFSSYHAEILRAEGLNLFDTTDVSAVSAATLAPYDIVILGEMPLSGAQVATFANWVSAGGNLIAMRPDKQLAGLLGLTDAGSTLSNAYLQIHSGSSPGTGIVSQTIQFHGTADRYQLSGATAVATLYSTATVSTANPAVTTRSVGSNGGSASAFLYDLARSIVYTRQGNPAWDGQERDGLPPIRSNDLFFGPASGDPQTDWVDRSKVAIPQADEQQRLLVNLILYVNAAKKPLPRFWYLPHGKQAAVVLTGDDHAHNGTPGRFDSHIAADPSGCSVADWECIRSTSYIYPSTPISDAEAAAYNAQGFEIAVHVSTTCGDYTPATLPNMYTGQLALFASQFPSLPAAVTNRTHCIAWSDWTTQADVEYANGIRLDTNYYWWPPDWVNDAPGFMTGSGMAMRFARKDGTTIDVYQAATQMTDESGQTYPATIDALLDAAVGSQGYYGTFVANIHTDSASGLPQLWSDQIVASAKARGVPVISARQLLTWLDGRGGSTFSNVAWSGNTLSFSAAVVSGATGLQALIPANSASGALTAIARGGTPIAYSLKTVKGIAYAAFDVAPGNYAVTYGGSPITVSVSPASLALNQGQAQQFIATVTGTANTAVTWSISPAIGTISALGLYTAPAVVAAIQNVTVTATLNFDPSRTATANLALVPGGGSVSSIRDTTVADFQAGSGSNYYISELDNGEVVLNPAHVAEFSGASLPAEYGVSPWNAGGAVTVAEGSATVDGARLDGPTFAAGRALEFTATFASDGFQHGGWGLDMNGPPWAIFSTNTGGALYARTLDGTQAVNTPIPGSWLNAPHRYRIEWTAANARFFIDGTEVASQPFSSPVSLHVLFSDFVVGAGSLHVSSVQVTPYSPSATFVSRVFDAGATTVWGGLGWTADTPAGATLAMRVRTGDTPVPDATWTPFTPVATSGGAITGSSRYLQYEAIFETTDPDRTAVLREVTAGSAIGAVAATNITNTGATIVWTTDTPRDSQVEYGTSSSYGQSSSLHTALGTTHAVPLTGLTPSTLYHYRVLSRDGGGHLAVSGDFTFTTGGASEPPVVSSLTASQSGAGILISWTTDQAATSRVDYGPNASSLPFVVSSGALVTTHAVLVNGLTPGTYYYRVTSCNGSGACAAAPVTGNPPLNFNFADVVPPTITAVTATPTANGASVAWQTDELATSRVDYGTEPGSLTLNATNSTLATAHNLTLSGLTPGVIYYYRVSSSDAFANPATFPAPPAAPSNFTTIASTAPAITALTAVPGIQGVATIRWTTSAAANSRVDYGVSPGALNLSVSAAANVTSHALQITGLTQGMRYYFRVTSTDPITTGTGVYPAPPAAPASFVENAISLWNAAATPAVTTNADSLGVELGMKFRSDLAGIATGVLFYKGGPANGGTHIGNLWSAAGNPLATVTFTNETASGWQFAAFSNPVAIAPNTTYVISYFAPTGGYPINTNYFTTPPYQNPPLRTLADGAEGGNGVYRYGSASGYPSSTYQASNYWVDVVFVDNVPPAISSVNAAVSGTNATVSWTSSEASASRIDYGVSASDLNLNQTAGTLVTANSLSLAGLTAATTYYYRVSSIDVSGNITVSPALNDPPLAFTTGVPDTTPPVISGVVVTPATSAATIAWTTDEPASSRVDYGTSAGSLTSTVSSPAPTVNHNLTLTGLAAGTTYYYRVISTDVSANVATLPPTPVAPASFVTVTSPAPVISAITVTPGSLGVATVQWTTNLASNSRVDFGTSPAALNQNVTDSSAVTSHTIRLTGLTQGAIYYYRVSSLDSVGGGLGTSPAIGDTAASFRQNARSVWDALATPGLASSPDTNSVELGLKFRSDAAGVATGVMFYKAPTNTGIHTGKLWSSTGSQLATVTFTNETASGWQQANFSTPVAISPNTTYIVSYHAPNGRYAFDENLFATTGVNNVPLRALANGTDGGNGVFVYGAGSAFPSLTYNASNYWVDVLFVDNIFPAISGVTATPGGVSALLSWTASEPASARVDYGTTAGSLTSNVSVAGLTMANSVTLTGLTQSTVYHYRVTSTDSSGNATVFPALTSAPLSFTTGTSLPPAISAVNAVTGSTSAIVTWATSLPANSQVSYGTSPAALNQTATTAPFVTSHSVTVGGLTAATTYYFRVTSATATGDAAIFPNPPTAPLSFTTSSSSGGGSGSPPSEWEVSGAGDPTIQGFTTDISYNVGETARFKISTTATAYRLDIYRMGYYGGDGALKVATVLPSATLPQTQPSCLNAPTTGLIDCGNWAESASWTIPAAAQSGIYFARLVRESGAPGASHVVFVVRNDASTADIVFQTSDTTWQAYNQYGGNSLYVGSPAGRAYKVSYNRPFTTRGTSPEDWVFNAEYPMVRWLEANGYDVTYTTGIDTDRRGNLLLNHKVFLSVGHDEYWSGTQRTNVEAARNAGVHLAFFSGNEVFWKTRWENSISSPATAYRTLVSYKETHANAKIDPTSAWTGTWRDPRAFNPEGAKPENRLTGTIFTVNCCTYAITVPEADGKMRLWRNTTIAAQTTGQTATLPGGTLGYEWDEDLDNGARPPGLIRMSTTTVSVPQRILDHGSSYGPGTATHALTLYKHTSGALVFGSGTVQWPWGLDSNHDRGSAAADIRMQQATVNLLADMGVQAGNLQPGLLPAVPSTDTAPPVTAIVNPASGANIPTGAAYTITGTASDTGGQVGGVEVSVDGGVTWRRAEGRTSWSYVWTPTATGSVTILSRATDDSGNIQTVPASRTTTVGTPPPVISNVTISGVTGTSVTVTWTTDRPANRRLSWGTNPASLTLTSAQTTPLATSHSRTASSLAAGTTYYFRVTSIDAAGITAVFPPVTDPPARFTTAHFPASATVQTGSFTSGNGASLVNDDNDWYQVASTTTGTRTTAWYGSFTGVPAGLSSLRVEYRGSNSAAATETVSIWNWTNSTWVQLDSRSVSTSEITRAELPAPGAASSYISGGQVRVRIQATRTANFTSRGEFMRLIYIGP